MIRRLGPLSVILLAALLAACGDSSAPATDPARTETESPTRANDAATADGNRSPSWSLKATGAEELDIEIEPRFGCSNEQVHILTMSQSPRFDLYLPAAIEPGRYPLAQFNPNADPGFVEGHAVVSVTGNIIRGSGSGYGTFYSRPDRGEITIERMPGGPGEFFTASIQATLASRDDERIELSAELNLQASGMMMMNCQF